MENNQLSIFGFKLIAIGRKEYGSTIFVGTKNKQTKAFKNTPSLNNMSIGGNVLVELQKREDDKAKFSERKDCVKKISKEYPEFASYLCSKKTESLIYIFYEYNKDKTIKKLFKRENGYLPDEIKGVQIIYDILCIYEIIHKLGIIHRLIKPEFVFYDDNNKLKLSLFVFCCKEVKFIKTTIDKDSNKPGGHIDSKSQRTQQAKDYDFNIDIWFIGELFYYLLYGKYPFPSNEQGDRKAKIKEFNVNNLLNISKESKDLLKVFFEKDKEKQMLLGDIFKFLFINYQGKIKIKDEHKNYEYPIREVNENDETRDTQTEDRTNRKYEYFSKEQFDKDRERVQGHFKTFSELLTLCLTQLSNPKLEVRKAELLVLYYLNRGGFSLWDIYNNNYGTKIKETGGEECHLYRNFEEELKVIIEELKAIEKKIKEEMSKDDHIYQLSSIKSLEDNIKEISKHFNDIKNRFKEDVEKEENMKDSFVNCIEKMKSILKDPLFECYLTEPFLL